MEIKVDIQKVISNLPVAINSINEDALQPYQWENTLFKLEELFSAGHQGHIMIASKSIISAKQLDTLSKYFPSIWVFFSLTGLNESKIFSFSDFQKSYLETCNKMEHVVCAIRPIIPTINDKIEILIPIIEMVQKGRKLLTCSGYIDPNIPGSSKSIDANLFTSIEKNCEIRRVTAKTKCACIISAVTKKPCIVHDLMKEPENLGIIEKLGYQFKYSNDKILLDNYKNSRSISKGDISFTRIITKCSTSSSTEDSSENLSIEYEGRRELFCKSSWLTWARRAESDIVLSERDNENSIDFHELDSNPLKILRDCLI